MTIVSNPIFLARYFGPFRIATNIKQEEFLIEETEVTIKHLIDQIISKYEDLQESFYIGSHLNNNVNVVINGEDIRSLQGLDTIITPKDRITFFKGVAGG